MKMNSKKFISKVISESISRWFLRRRDHYPGRSIIRLHSSHDQPQTGFIWFCWNWICKMFKKRIQINSKSSFKNFNLWNWFKSVLVTFVTKVSFVTWLCNNFIKSRKAIKKAFSISETMLPSGPPSPPDFGFDKCLFFGFWILLKLILSISYWQKVSFR